jgi:integrase
MQRGCMQRNSRKEGPDAWQFRWSETRLDGKRLYHKKIIGTVEQYPDEDAARRAVVGLVSEINTDAPPIQVESWIRGLPLAKSSCAKIRNLMSVLFNHACRYELFDRNPIYLVRQSAKRRTPPAILVPAEIKALIDGLALRERTLVLLAASTGLRQSEIIGLKWGDIDFERGTMSVIRSIVYGVVGPCKTESSQKPVPMHPTLADALMQWRKRCTYIKSEDWVFASKRYRGRRPYWGQDILRKYLRPRRNESEFRSDSDGIRSGTPTRPCCEAWGLSSR